MELDLGTVLQLQQLPIFKNKKTIKDSTHGDMRVLQQQLILRGVINHKRKQRYKSVKTKINFKRENKL